MYVIVPQASKHRVFYCFFCVACHIAFPTVTLTDCSEIAGFCFAGYAGGKRSKRFIVVLMYVYMFCSIDTNNNFYDCNRLHQLSNVTLWFGHHLHFGCLCLSQSWMPPNCEWKQAMYLGWSPSQPLSKSIEVNLTLLHYWITQNLDDAPFCGGWEGYSLHHWIDLASGTRIHGLGFLLQPFYFSQIDNKILHEE